MSVTNVLSLASYALIAQAAYAKSTNKGDFPNAATRDAKFTATQFDNFKLRYLFIDTLPNGPDGFSATVFKDIASGR